MTHDQIEEARYLHEQQELSYAKIGEVFHVSQWTIKRALSKRRSLEQQQTYTCAWCGKVFQGGKGRKFCSPKCARAMTLRRWRENHRDLYNERKRAWWQRRKERLAAVAVAVAKVSAEED